MSTKKATAKGGAQTPTAQMLAKIKDSNLTAVDAKKLGFTAYSASEMALTFPELPRYAAGFVLPYYNAKGKLLPTYRFRYFDIPLTGFAKLTGGKAPAKYMQPSTTPPAIYLPALGTVKWASVLQDPKQGLVLTEGELKSACACKAGIPCIGLGGVWNFMSKKHGHTWLPQLEEIVWEGRNVHVVYDSDILYKPDVQLALAQLCDNLTRRGAVVMVVHLSGPEEKKVGLDDYLVKHGITKFMDLMEKAEPWAMNAALHRLNGEVAYIEQPSMIVQLSDFSRMKVRTFWDEVYAPRNYIEIIGEKQRKRQPAKEFIEWSHRRQYRSITYAPGKPIVTEDNELNTWQPGPIEPRKGYIGPWVKLLDYLFAEEGEQPRNWFEQWLAYPLQYPGTKLFSACILWSTVHGTGKTLVGHTMQRIYGPNFVEIGARDLSGDFNSWGANRQFVLGEEITGNDNRSMADNIKRMITQRQIRINEKYVPAYTIPDYVNYYFTSNHQNAFYLEDTDRRFFVVNVSKPPLPLRFYTEEYDKWYKSDSGVAALYYYLLNEVDTTNFLPLGPAMQTQSKMEMRLIGKSDLATWVYDLKHTPENILRIGDQPLRWRTATAIDLLRLYDADGTRKVTMNRLGMELQAAGFIKLNNGEAVAIGNGMRQRVWLLDYTPGGMAELLRLGHGQIGEFYNKEHNMVIKKGAKW